MPKQTNKPATKPTGKSSEKTGKSSPSSPLPEENICFVISPIGKEGTDNYNKFKEVLDYIIKPAVESSSLKLKVVRRKAWGQASKLTS